MEKRARGRPSFKPTAAQRSTVAIAAGGGMTHFEIAMGLGISQPTLLKHFERELSVGAHAKRLEIVKALHAAAKRGSVAAAKAYMLLEPTSSAPPVPTPPKPVKEEPLGKKGQASLDAIDAAKDTGWEGILQ